MKPIFERSTIAINQDVYTLRARPHHSQVLVNLGYRHIGIVDCVNASIVRKIELPKSVGDFGVESWLVTPDGDRSYLFGRDVLDTIIEIEHDSGAARPIVRPGELTAPVGFCWFSPGLHLIDCDRQTWMLENNRFVPIGPGPATTVTRPLRERIVEFDQLAVIRMAPSHPGVYLFGNDVLGFASIDAKEVELIPNQSRPIDVARWANGLAVCFESRVVLHEGTHISTFLNAEPEEYFVALERVQHLNNAYLVIVASGLDASSATLRIFRA
jgi:hypothetical protein